MVRGKETKCRLIESRPSFKTQCQTPDFSGEGTLENSAVSERVHQTIVHEFVHILGDGPATVECFTFTVQNDVQSLTLECHINGSFLLFGCVQEEWIKPSLFTC